jgi:hypothetical protein
VDRRKLGERAVRPGIGVLLAHRHGLRERGMAGYDHRRDRGGEQIENSIHPDLPESADDWTGTAGKPYHRDRANGSDGAADPAYNPANGGSVCNGGPP